MNVIKRNGEEVPFDPDKIRKAIAGVNNDLPDDKKMSLPAIALIANSVVATCCTFDHPLSVEEIQDIVEKALAEHGLYQASKEYILYRYKRAQIRQQKALTEKLTASNVQNQNANVDEASFGGRLGEAASFVTKQYALDHLMSKMAVRNHLNNEIYTHDLDSYALGSHNCLSIPFDKLLANGFNTRQTDVRPAGSLNTAFQLVAVIFQLQSLQQFGGVAATHLDWTMVPYLRLSFFKHYCDGIKYICEAGDVSDDFTKEEIKKLSIDDPYYTVEKAKIYAIEQTTRELNQAVEGMLHNLNTLQSRSGCQLPFTSINYGTCTLVEGRMVTKAIIEGTIKGVGKFHKTSIFPCGIFQCMKGVNRKPGDPNYDLFRLALKSTAQRIYPNYANVDWSNAAGYDPENPETYFSTMGCLDGKSVIDYKIGDTRYVESFEAAWERMSRLYPVQTQADGKNHFIDTPDVTIWDCVEGKYVAQKRIIRNTQEYWYKMTFSNGTTVEVTDDHPFEVEYDGVVLARDMNEGDEIKCDTIKEPTDGSLEPVHVVETCELVDKLSYKLSKYSYDVTTESEHFTVNGLYSHNCRTANLTDVNAEDPKLAQLKDGRGNICPCSIILPELAFQAKTPEAFLELLDKKIHEAKDQLIERFNWICSQPAAAAKFMYENGTMYGYKPEEGIRSALKHGTLAIGQLGLAECLQILIGCDHTDPKGMKLAKKIEGLFKKRCAEFKQEYKLNFGVYYTPKYCWAA